MRVQEAKFKLETTVQGCSGRVRKIVVIHGCNSGTALMDMVRTDLQSPYISEIKPDYFNNGQTIILIKK